MPESTQGAFGHSADSYPVDFDDSVALVSFRLGEEVVSFTGEYDGMDAENLEELVGSYWSGGEGRILQLLGDYHGHAVYRTLTHSHHPTDLGTLSKLGMMSWARLLDETERADPETLVEHGIDPTDDGTPDIDLDARTETAPDDAEAAAAEVVEEIESAAGDDSEYSAISGDDITADLEFEPQMHIQDASVFIHELGCDAIEIDPDYENERIIVRPHHEGNSD